MVKQKINQILLYVGATLNYLGCLIGRTNCFIMKKLLFITGLIAINISISIAQVTETRALEDFSEITVGEAIDLILVPGNKNEARIETSNIDLEDVRLEVRGNNLKVDLEGTRHRNINVKITLTYKSIEAISISSAASVSTKGAIKSSSLDIDVSTAGNANLEIEASEINIDVTSAGELELKGSTISQRVNVSSAGEYRGYNLNCQDAYVRVSSAGSVRVMATKKIDAKANSAGSVVYKGNPQKVYVNTSSGGSARKSS